MFDQINLYERVSGPVNGKYTYREYRKSNDPRPAVTVKIDQKNVDTFDQIQTDMVQQAAGMVKKSIRASIGTGIGLGLASLIGTVIAVKKSWIAKALIGLLAGAIGSGIGFFTGLTIANKSNKKNLAIIAQESAMAKSLIEK